MKKIGFMIVMSFALNLVGCSPTPSVTEKSQLVSATISAKVSTSETVAPADACVTSWSKVENFKKEGTKITGTVSVPEVRVLDLAFRNASAYATPEACEKLAETQKKSLSPNDLAFSTYVITVDTKTGKRESKEPVRSPASNK